MLRKNTKIEIVDWTEEGLKKLFSVLKNSRGLKLTITLDETGEAPLQKGIAKSLAECQISPQLNGYRYLQAAIDLGITDRGMLESVTKKMYPTIAKMYNVDVASVEHGIRHAITKAWEYDDGAYMRELFGNSLRNPNKRPSNAGFIATLVDYLEYYIS